MQRTTPAKITILILAIVVIIAVAFGSFALAYWAGTPELDINGNNATVVDNDENATTKYLIFAPNYVFDDDYCFEYSDASGWVLKYEYGSDYVMEGGQHNAGERNSAESVKSTTYKNTGKTISALIKETGVKVVGYIGALGQYENLVIPSEISWDGNEHIAVAKINIKMMEYKTSMDLITGVEIPASIVAIEDVSFSGAGNLLNVYFKGVDSTTITKASGLIDDRSFVGMNSSINYWNSAGEEITNIRA